MEIQIGDLVRMVRGTALWTKHKHLRDRPGVVTDIVDEDVQMLLLTVVFTEDAFEGEASEFEKVQNKQ